MSATRISSSAPGKPAAKRRCRRNSSLASIFPAIQLDHAIAPRHVGALRIYSAMFDSFAARKMDLGSAYARVGALGLGIPRNVTLITSFIMRNNHRRN